MKVEEMTRITVLCPKHYMEKVINKLYDLNVYHIEDHQKTEELDISKPLEKGEKLAEILIKIRAIISYLNIEPDDSDIRKENKKLNDKDYFELGKKSKKLYVEASENIDEIKRTNESMQALNEKISVLKLLKSLNISREELKETAMLSRFIGSIQDFTKFREGLDRITGRYELTSYKTETNRLIALFVQKDYEQMVSELLSQNGFNEIDITHAELKEKNINDELSKTIRELKEEEEKLRSAESALRKLRTENRNFLLRNEKMLSEESKKAEIPLKFGESQKVFVINGWVPAKELEKVKGAVTEITNGRVYIESRPYMKGDNVPIKLRHTRLTKPFEFLLNLYELPNYKEIDPVLMMFITFPIFFGIMLGDVGYGLVCAVMFWLIKKKMPKGKALLNVMIYSAIITMLFGFAFGEYFGFEHLSYGSGMWLCNNTGICLKQTELHEPGEEDAAGEASQEAAPPAEAELQAPSGSPLIQEPGGGQDADNIDNSDSDNSDSADNDVASNAASAAAEAGQKKAEGENKLQEASEQMFGEEPESEKNAEETETGNESTEPVIVYDFPRLLNRTHGFVNIAGFDIFSVLIIGIVLGFFHLNIGLFIGFVNISVEHGIKDAFYEKISWMIMETGVIFLVLSFAKIWEMHWALGAAVFLLGTYFIYKGEGVKGIVELPSIFSNMLSYMRLGAVGLASVGLAVVVNERLALPIIYKGGVLMFIAGVIIFICGHAINIALGVIGPFLHSLRLHYVEFFSKFYHGGGLPYDPFGYKKEE